MRIAGKLPVILRRLAGVGAALGCLLTSACGGNVERTGTGDEGSNPPSDTDAPTSSDPGVKGDTELGSCKLGKPAYEDFDQPCAWIADDLCYEEREMACNCACPRKADSLCTSGFGDGEDGRVWVSCQ